MFYEEHNPPHFHAIIIVSRYYIAINDLRIIKGSLPPKAIASVMERATIHKDELLEEWDRVEKKQELFKIDPLY